MARLLFIGGGGEKDRRDNYKIIKIKPTFLERPVMCIITPNRVLLIQHIKPIKCFTFSRIKLRKGVCAAAQVLKKYKRVERRCREKDVIIIN